MADPNIKQVLVAAHAMHGGPPVYAGDPLQEAASSVDIHAAVLEFLKQLVFVSLSVL